MDLRRLLISDNGEDPALNIHYSDLLGDRALSQYVSFTCKMVLKRPFIGYTGEDCTFIVQVSWETELSMSVQQFYSEDSLGMAGC